MERTQKGFNKYFITEHKCSLLMMGLEVFEIYLLIVPKFL